MMRALRCVVALLAVWASGCGGPTTGARSAPTTPDSAVPTSARQALGTSGLQQVWRWDAPARASVGMPASDGRSVSFTYGHAGLVLLDGDGSESWRSPRRGLRPAAPLLTTDLVVAATEDGVGGYRRSDGRELWHAALGQRANSPVEVAGVLVVTTWEGSLVGLRPKDGSVLWRTSLGGVALAPPAGEGSTAAATWEAEGGSAAGILAVEATTGRRRWERPLPPGGVSGPAAGDGRVVAVAGDQAAHALALRDGGTLWRVRTEDAGSAEVAPRPVGGPGGGVLVAHRLGGLVFVGPDGQVGWTVASDAAAVRGGPAGPGRRGRYALPLDDGRLLLGGPRETEVLDPPGLVSGVALGPGGALLVATAGGGHNHLYAISGW